jgi:putative PIN family toxin of toxin-antitoxin system
MPKNKKIRLAVDANVWISTLLSPRFQLRIEVVFGEKYRLMVSEELFDDLERAINKPHLARRINRTDYDELVSKLRSVAELVDVHSVVEICRDPKDNFLLALAKDGNADYLITGDNDLLVLKKFEKTKIVTLSDFEAVFHRQCESFLSQPVC